MKNTYKPVDRTEREPSSKEAFKSSNALTVDDIRRLKEILTVRDLRSISVLEAPYTSNRKRIIDNTSIVDLWKVAQSQKQ